MAGFNVFLLVVEMAVYFTAMLALFRLRETLPLDISLSPGSVVLFSGKLALILLIYIREDALVARQPIYGLFIGNILLIGLVALLRQHDAVAAPGVPADLSFMDAMGLLMMWGTLLLFIDAIAMILIYERIARPLRRMPILAIWVTLALVLTFDQVAFFGVLSLAMGVPLTAGIGGWGG